MKWDECAAGTIIHNTKGQPLGIATGTGLMAVGQVGKPYDQGGYSDCSGMVYETIRLAAESEQAHKDCGYPDELLPTLADHMGDFW